MIGHRSTLRLGLIGAGRWGSNYVRTIEAAQDAILTRICTKRSDISALVGPECRVERRWQSLIEARDIDGVIIATPPRLHFRMAHYAMSHDIPVLVEKPLTMNVRQARTLGALALERGVPLLVDHVYLYHPAYRVLRSELRGKGPFRIESSAGDDGPYRPDTSVLWDYGPHDLAMCMDLVGETPTHVSARRLDRTAAGAAVAETLQLHLEFSTGDKADISLSNQLRNRTRLLSIRTGSELLVFDDSAEIKLYREPVGTSGRREPIPYIAEPPLTVAVREFGEAIVRRRSNVKDTSFATDVVAVLARCAAALRRAASID
jgi:predicted dehydrogenase